MYASIERAIVATVPPTPMDEVVRLAQRKDQSHLIATLTSAFIADPPTRWLFPEPASYLSHFPRFARAFGGGALGLGTVWQVQGRAACALWFPPGTAPDEQPFRAMVENCVPVRRHAEVFAVFEAMGDAHPSEPHWYLPLIGVCQAFQGLGLGAALLRETLRICDRDGMPAYLEATSPRSVPLYERHGFRRRNALRVGDCPPITPMWREPVTDTYARTFS